MDTHTLEDFDGDAPATFDRVRDLLGLSFPQAQEDVLNENVAE